MNKANESERLQLFVLQEKGKIPPPVVSCPTRNLKSILPKAVMNSYRNNSAPLTFQLRFHPQMLKIKNLK